VDEMLKSLMSLVKKNSVLAEKANTSVNQDSLMTFYRMSLVTFIKKYCHFDIVAPLGKLSAIRQINGKEVFYSFFLFSNVGSLKFRSEFEPCQFKSEFVGAT